MLKVLLIEKEKIKSGIYVSSIGITPFFLIYKRRRRE
jgi:hypothetical protein